MTPWAQPVCRISGSRALSSRLGTAVTTAQRCTLRQSARIPAVLVRNVQSSPNATARVVPIQPWPANMRSMVTITKTEAGSTPVSPPQVAVTQSSSAGTASASTSDDQDIIVTASCAQQIKRLAAKRSDGGASLYLRLYVDAGGCSGFEYKFELETDDGGSATTDREEEYDDDDEDEDEMTGIDPDDDVVFAKDGARVVIDKASLELLRGSTVDFVQEMIRSSFAVVSNPISESACGCGTSFAVKNFSENPALD